MENNELHHHIERYASSRRDRRVDLPNPVDAEEYPQFKDLKDQVTIKERSTLVAVQSKDRRRIAEPYYGTYRQEIPVGRIRGNKGSSVLQLTVTEGEDLQFDKNSFLATFTRFPTDPVRTSFYGVDRTDILFQAELGRPIFQVTVSDGNHLTVSMPTNFVDSFDIESGDSGGGSGSVRLLYVEEVREAYPFPNNYVIDLPRVFRQVKSVSLVSAELPNTQPVVHQNTRIVSTVEQKEDASRFSYRSNTRFVWNVETDYYVDGDGNRVYYDYSIDVPEGTYNATELLQRIINQTNVTRRRTYEPSLGQWVYQASPDLFQPDDVLYNRFQFALNENQTALYLAAIAPTQFSVPGSVSVLQNQSRLFVNATDYYGTRQYPQNRPGDKRIFEGLTEIDGPSAANLNTEHRIEASPLYVLYVQLSRRRRALLERPLYTSASQRRAFLRAETQARGRTAKALSTDYSARLFLPDAGPCLHQRLGDAGLVDSPLRALLTASGAAGGTALSGLEALALDRDLAFLRDPSSVGSLDGSWSPFVLPGILYGEDTGRYRLPRAVDWTEPALLRGYYGLRLEAPDGRILYDGRVLTVFGTGSPAESLVETANPDVAGDYAPERYLLVAPALPPELHALRPDFRALRDPAENALETLESPRAESGRLLPALRAHLAPLERGFRRVRPPLPAEQWIRQDATGTAFEWIPSATYCGMQVLRLDPGSTSLYVGDVERVGSSLLEQAKVRTFVASAVKQTPSAGRFAVLPVSGHPLLSLVADPGSATWDDAASYEYPADHVLRKAAAGTRAYSHADDSLDRRVSPLYDEADAVACSGHPSLGLLQTRPWTSAWRSRAELRAVSAAALAEGPLSGEREAKVWLTFLGSQNAISPTQNVRLFFRVQVFQPPAGEDADYAAAGAVHRDFGKGTTSVSLLPFFASATDPPQEILLEHSSGLTFALRPAPWHQLAYGMTWEFFLAPLSVSAGAGYGTPALVDDLGPRDANADAYACAHDDIWAAAGGGSEAPLQVCLTSVGRFRENDQETGAEPFPLYDVRAQRGPQLWLVPEGGDPEGLPDSEGLVLGVFQAVHAEATQRGLDGQEASELPSVRPTAGYNAGSRAVLLESSLQDPETLYGEWITGEASRAHAQVVFGLQQVDLADDTVLRELGVCVANLEHPAEAGLHYSYGRLVVALHGVDLEAFQVRGSAFGAETFFELYQNFVLHETLLLDSYAEQPFGLRLVGSPLPLHAVNTLARFGQMDLFGTDNAPDSYRTAAGGTARSLPDGLPGSRRLWLELAAVLGLAERDYVANARRLGSIRDQGRTFLAALLTAALESLDDAGLTDAKRDEIRGLLGRLAAQVHALHPEFHHYLRVRRPDLFGNPGTAGDGPARFRSTNGFTSPFYLVQPETGAAGVVVSMHLPSHVLEPLDFSKRQVKLSSSTWRNKTQYGWSDGRGVFSLEFYRDIGQNDILPLPEHALFYHAFAQWGQFPVLHPYQYASRYRLTVSGTDADPTPDALFQLQEQEDEDTVLPHVTRGLYPSYKTIVDDGRLQSLEFGVPHAFLQSDGPAEAARRVLVVSHAELPLWAASETFFGQYPGVDVSGSAFQALDLDLLSYLNRASAAQQTFGDATDLRKQGNVADGLAAFLPNPWDFWETHLDEAARADGGNAWLQSLVLLRALQDLEGFRPVGPTGRFCPQDDVTWRLFPALEGPADRGPAVDWTFPAVNPWELHRAEPPYTDASGTTVLGGVAEPRDQDRADSAAQRNGFRRPFVLDVVREDVLPRITGTRVSFGRALDPRRFAAVEALRVPHPDQPDSAVLRYLPFHSGAVPLRDAAGGGAAYADTALPDGRAFPEDAADCGFVPSSFPNLADGDAVPLGAARVQVSLRNCLLWALDRFASAEAATGLRTACERLDRAYWVVEVFLDSGFEGRAGARALPDAFPPQGQSVADDPFVHRFVVQPLVQWNASSGDADRRHVSSAYLRYPKALRPVGPSSTEIAVFEVDLGTAGDLADRLREGDVLGIGPCLYLVKALQRDTAVQSSAGTGPRITLEPPVPSSLLDPGHARAGEAFDTVLHPFLLTLPKDAGCELEAALDCPAALALPAGFDVPADFRLPQPHSPVLLRTGADERFWTRCLEMHRRPADGRWRLLLADAPPEDREVELFLADLAAVPNQGALAAYSELAAAHVHWVPVPVALQSDFVAAPLDDLVRADAFPGGLADPRFRGELTGALQQAVAAEAHLLSDQFAFQWMAGLQNFFEGGTPWFRTASQDQARIVALTADLPAATVQIPSAEDLAAGGSSSTVLGLPWKLRGTAARALLEAGPGSHGLVYATPPQGSDEATAALYRRSALGTWVPGAVLADRPGWASAQVVLGPAAAAFYAERPADAQAYQGLLASLASFGNGNGNGSGPAPQLYVVLWSERTTTFFREAADTILPVRPADVETATRSFEEQWSQVLGVVSTVTSSARFLHLPRFGEEIEDEETQLSPAARTRLAEVRAEAAAEGPRWPFALNVHTRSYAAFDHNSYQVQLEKKGGDNPLFSGDIDGQVLLASATERFVGSSFTILQPVAYRIRFDGTDTLGSILGFPHVGNRFGLTDFDTIHRNESAVFEAYLERIELSSRQPLVDSLLFQKLTQQDRLVFHVRLRGSTRSTMDAKHLFVGQSFRVSDVEPTGEFAKISRAALLETSFVVETILLRPDEQVLVLTALMEGLDPVRQNPRRSSGILFVNGKIRFLKTERPLQLVGPTSLYLVSRRLSQMETSNGIKDVFCKILVTESPGNILFNTQITNGFVPFDSPLDRLETIDLFFLDDNHQTYDFGNVDHSLVFEITEYIHSIPSENVNRSSRTGLRDAIPESKRIT